jgi:hypothetical protein
MKTALQKQPETSPARESLREALVAVNQSKSAVSTAGQIAARAVADLKEANDTLKSFEGLDARIATFRVEALKGGRWAGWPEELRAERLEKLAATEEAEHALAAAQTLNGELETARENLRDAEKQFDLAALDLFSETITDVVTQLDECNRQQKYLQLTLQGVGLPNFTPGHWQRLLSDQQTLILQNVSLAVGFPHGDAARWKLINRLAEEAIHPDAVRERSDAVEKLAAYWKTFAAALHDDPEALPGPLPSRDSILV